MASPKASFFFSVLFHGIFLCSSSVMGCDTDVEVRVFEGINVYRTFLNLPSYHLNLKAACFADKFANKLIYQPCNSTFGTGANNKVKLDNYTKDLLNCGIYPNHTTDSVVMPVCVPKLDATQVITNYTGTQYKRYLNDSRYVTAGVGSKRDWMVIILSTNTTRGDFAAEKSSVSKVGFRLSLVSLLLGMILYRFC